MIRGGFRPLYIISHQDIIHGGAEKPAKSVEVIYTWKTFTSLPLIDRLMGLESHEIENYFFQFGKDAKIISPEKYAIKFGEEYKAAYEVYTSLPK